MRWTSRLPVAAALVVQGRVGHPPKNANFIGRRGR
jgi:hypothetical protein